MSGTLANSGRSSAPTLRSEGSMTWSRPGTSVVSESRPHLLQFAITYESSNDRSGREEEYWVDEGEDGQLITLAELSQGTESQKTVAALLNGKLADRVSHRPPTYQEAIVEPDGTGRFYRGQRGRIGFQKPDGSFTSWGVGSKAGLIDKGQEEYRVDYTDPSGRTSSSKGTLDELSRSGKEPFRREAAEMIKRWQELEPHSKKRPTSESSNAALETESSTRSTSFGGTAISDESGSSLVLARSIL
ncbi:hypothetical protein IAR55_001542 [Kwoniella newhampshirensis]|uniref:CAP-Gly domain-containing protein n=1 Tax=Kwoniella newhampshirensis TaxID=1651941 RepID=A0AAW0Z2G5_9TREE